MYMQLTNIAALLSITLSEIFPLLSHCTAGVPQRKQSLSFTSSLQQTLLSWTNEQEQTRFLSACPLPGLKEAFLSSSHEKEKGKYLSLQPWENRVDTEFPCKYIIPGHKPISECVAGQQKWTACAEAPQLSFCPGLWQKGTTLDSLDLFFLPA